MPIKAITRTILDACFYLRLLMTTKYFVVWTVFFFFKRRLTLINFGSEKKIRAFFLESFSHLATTIRAIYRLKCLYPGHNYNLI